MFSPEERDRLRDVLVSVARADDAVLGAALTGSASVGAEDRWSDIDLALSVAADADISQVITSWTDLMYEDHQAIHHLDVISGTAVYRVFLLATTLQVDIAFWPAAEFGATAPTFRLLFGTAAERVHSPGPDATELVGLGWLYALHARSSIERGRVWQAEYMISAVRDHVLALACLRHGVPASQGRGMDRLPSGVTGPLAEALVRSLDVRELSRAFAVAIEALVVEIRQVDAGLADRLAGPLRELAGSVTVSAPERSKG